MADEGPDPDAWVRLRGARSAGGISARGNGGASSAASSSSSFALRRPGAFSSRGRVVAASPRDEDDETGRQDDAEDANDGDDDDDGDDEDFEEDAMTQDILADTPESPPRRSESPPTPTLPNASESTGDTATVSSPPPPPAMVTLTSPTTAAVPIPLVAAEPSTVPAMRRQTSAVRDAASLSPVDTPTVSGEDDDYRSETSSEVSTSRGSHPRKNIVSSCADHRDLSKRLRQAVHNSADAIGFDETLIGADVVLCVRRRRSDLARRKRLPRHSDSDEDDDEEMTEVAPQSPDGAPEIQRFHAHRFMLAASSAPFKAMLTGRMRESSERDVEIHGIAAPIVEKMLLFIYTGEVVLGLENVVGLLVASEMYELEALREMCKGFVLNHAHEVFRDPQIVQVPEKLLLELIQQDELQIRELALMEALVMWGEARTPSGDKTELGKLLREMMEFVRFPTMSVGDLYGKVRPLVHDGVIAEALLTEALFHHLKWGSQSGQASQRTKPRQLTASLRKRKRVSFIQHVSFVPT